ncbi:MAG TPA: hypothetical protein PKC62_13260 [Ferruginibacter sp.]|nr:hypothetical protein [Bacteroidota bacterium]HMT97651.1 hypothetical protein [Ferruginibacter sp.]HRB31478.1 hypothetical protein [Ferruginibacter sp.]
MNFAIIGCGRIAQRHAGHIHNMGKWYAARQGTQMILKKQFMQALQQLQQAAFLYIGKREWGY